MSNVRDAYIYLLDKTADAEDSQKVALVEYAANRSDQRAQLMELFDTSAVAEKTDEKLMKSILSDKYDHEPGNPLLKVATDVARDILYRTVNDRAPNYVKEAMVHSFGRELDKIGVIGMAPPKDNPFTVKVPKGLYGKASKAVATHGSIPAARGAGVAAAAGKAVAKPGVLGKAMKAVRGLVTR